MKALRAILLFLLAVVIVAAITPGCNTIRGVGKDIERGGEKIQETVK